MNITTDAAPAATYPRVYHPELADYLEARVRVADSGCWEWTLSTNGSGYGSGKHYMGKLLRAHRLAFLCALDFLPPAPYVIRHICGNRLCCRPNHLGAGTLSENSRDAIKHGTAYVPRLKGELHGYSKLTEEAVRAIRASADHNSVLADRYGVTADNIRAVRKRITWRHLEDATVPYQTHLEDPGRGGAHPGEDHHKAKLTDDAVRAIRASRETNAALADRYGVATATISLARRGLSWTHVTP